MIFEIGKTYYAYQDTLGMMKVVFVDHIIEDGNDKCFFMNEQGNKIEMVSTQFEYFKPSEDEALLDFFIRERETLQLEIERSEKQLSKYKKRLGELNNKYNHLKEIYPEEFI